MKKDSGKPSKKDLRRQAEGLLAARQDQADAALAEADLKRLVYELQVHQAELELQNEELRNARLELEASLERYADLYDFAPAGYFTLDEHGVIREVNLSGARLLGDPRSKVIGQRLAVLMEQESTRIFHEFLGRLARGGERRSCQVTLKTLEGQPRHLHLEGVALEREPGASGTAVPCRLAALDVSELKRTEEGLASSQAFNQSIIDSSPDCVKVLDLEGRLTYMSPGGQRILGIGDLAPYLNQPYESFWSGSNLAAVREALELARSGSAGKFHGYCPTVTGEPKWWDVSISPIFDSQGYVGSLLAISRDVTERKLAEEEKSKVEAQLRQAQKMEAIGTLAGGIAHDFNNILGAILGYAEMAKDDALGGKADPEELKQIISSVGRAKTLIRQILAFSRRATPSLSALDLSLKVEELALMLQRMLPKEIAIEIGLEEGLPKVNCDSGQMDQMIMNLATNARDAMPEGGQFLIETRRAVLDEEFNRRFPEVIPGEYVLLKLSDTGQGMDQHTMERIYDPFFTTKEIGKGTGLGLSTVHGIVKSHGGHIFCHSAPGRGTSFDIYLPALSPDVANLSEEAEAIPTHGHGERILLVDDEDALRTIGSKVMRAAGYEVLTASTGEEALEICRLGSPQLVVLDLGMPGMGGLKCLKEILALEPGAKVIIASGFSAEIQINDTLKAGAVGYVAKPFKKAELLATVRSVLDRT